MQESIPTFTVKAYILQDGALRLNSEPVQCSVSDLESTLPKPDNDVSSLPGLELCHLSSSESFMQVVNLKGSEMGFIEFTKHMTLSVTACI